MKTLTRNNIRSNGKAIARIKRFYQNYEVVFLTLTRKALAASKKEFMEKAIDIIRNKDMSAVGSLEFSVDELYPVLYNYMAEGRRVGRELGLTEGLELKQYWEDKRQKKQLEFDLSGIFDTADKFIEQFTRALSPTNKNIVSNFSVVPQNTLDYYADYSLQLSNVFETDLLNKAKQKIYSGIENGLSIQDIRFSLQDVFTQFSSWRLQNIARTELTKAFNQGRLEAFKSPHLDGFIVALQFTGVWDDRTSDICEERLRMNNGHGLILKIGDPRIPANTPPLHFQCRSSWLPVDKYSLIEEGLDQYIGAMPGGLIEPMAGFGGKTVVYFAPLDKNDIFTKLGKPLKNLQEVIVLEKKIRAKVEDEFNAHAFLSKDVIFAKSEKEFYQYLGEVDDKAIAFYKDGLICYHPIHVTGGVKKGLLPSITAMFHENIHAIRRGIRFSLDDEINFVFSEGVTEYLSRKMLLKFGFATNYEDVINMDARTLEMSYVLSHLAVKNNYNIERVGKIIENANIGHSLGYLKKPISKEKENQVKLDFQELLNSVPEITQESYNEQLKKLRKKGFCVKEIDSYFEKLKIKLDKQIEDAILRENYNEEQVNRLKILKKPIEYGKMKKEKPLMDKHLERAILRWGLKMKKD